MAGERDRGRADGSGLDATRAGPSPFAAAEVDGAVDTVAVAVTAEAAGGLAETRAGAALTSTRSGEIGEARGERSRGVIAAARGERRSAAFGGHGPQGTPETDDTVAMRVTPASTTSGVARSATEATRAGGRFVSSTVEETRLGSVAAFVDDAAPEAVSAALLAVAETGRIGRFVVLRELGRGAMGVVFAAYDEELDRKVAIKLLHASRGDDASLGRAMLLREAQALARLAHPNVVAVHEVGTIAGAVFVAMEYVAGVDLQRWLTTEKRGWRDIVAVLRQAGEGLVAAHREGLVHRDFKPSNVLVGDDGRVRVADFGLAARRGATGVGTGARPASVTLTATLTGEGALVGTPVYMAPELLRGAPATAASDQYAYCVALYEALYGARPFDADTLAKLTDTVEHRPLPAVPLRSDVPGWLHAAVCRGLAKAPERRFAGLTELVELLARDPEAERQQRRRRALQIAGAIGGTAAIVALLVFGAAAVRRFAAERQADGRLAAWREQAAELRGRGEAEEAGRLLQTFVALPENRGMTVVAQAYLEWAAAQTDDAAAVDAYASAYIAARTPEHGRAALLGLIERLSAREQVNEAAAALSVLEREAPETARAPALQAVRLAAALARRDLTAAGAALAAGDEGGWAPVLKDMFQVTAAPAGVFAALMMWPHMAQVIDFDGDGAVELVRTDPDAGIVRVFAADLGFAPRRTIAVGPATRLVAVPAVVPGEPLLVSGHPTSDPRVYELRVTTATEDGTTRRIDAWDDSGMFSPVTADVDGDGRRELYIGTEAYARKLWRLDRAGDGVWSRGSAHRPTDATGSDIMGLEAADLDGDGVDELMATVGPWKAYDVRVFKKGEGRELDQVARRSLGSFRSGTAGLRVGGRGLVAVIKADAQIAPDRFPPDRPLGAPAGLYVFGMADGAIAEVGFVADSKDGTEMVLGPLRAGDLDGDGDDELVIDANAQGMMLVRLRPGQPLQPLTIAGLRPLLVHDLDGDGDAEIVAVDRGEAGRILILGAGEATLPLLPARDVDPRPVPPGIADPAIAEAWRRAEQLVAIGLPGRTAGELAAIARLAGPVAPDMLLRTAELYAAVGEDALAAEHYAAAAARPDIAAAALAGGAAARRRLGEFAAAAELTRRRLAVTPAGERAAVETELAALAEATAARPELALTFARPLDPRWRVLDPVAAQRGLVAQSLSLWAAPGTLAELPLVWDGGPAALEVEMDVDVLEWGTGFTVEVTGAEDRPWLVASIGAFGLSDRPERRISVADDPRGGERTFDVTGEAVRVRLAVVPGFDTTIREVERDGTRVREVGVLRRRPSESAVPQAGPLRLRIRGTALQAGFVGHAHVRAIRLTGFTMGEADAAGPVDAAARMLVEGELAGAAAALQGEVGTMRQVWRIDALLRLGDVAGATAEMRGLLAATSAEGPVYEALLMRVRRDDEVARLAGRAAFGPRWIDTLLLVGSNVGVRPIDVPEVLAGLAAPDPTAPTPTDPEALRRLVLTHYARGAALRHVGRAEAARAAFAAAYALVHDDGPDFPGRGVLHGQFERILLDLAAASGDVAAVQAWVRTIVMGNTTPYLALERLQSNPAVARLVEPAVWAGLTEEIKATRERPRAP